MVRVATGKVARGDGWWRGPEDVTGWRGAAKRGGRAATWPVVLGWVVTRTALMLELFGAWHYPGWDVRPDVEVIYHGWFQVLQTGSFPVGDVTWQYPPAAAGAFLAPALLSFLPYAQAFYVLACLADAVVFGLLLRAARRTPDGGVAGPWLWVAGIAVLGPMALARYDVMVTVLAVAALLAVARRPRVAGALAAIGALVKVWPVLVLFGTKPGRTTRRVWTSAAVTAALVSAAFLAFTHDPFAFLTEQRERGMEVESLGALPFHVLRFAGVWHGTLKLHYGSFEFLGPYVATACTISLAVSAVAFCWLVWWRVRSRTYEEGVVYDAAFAAVLVFVTTSRVISPQYMIWLLGLGGLCLTCRSTVQRLPVVLTLIACAFTVVEFPIAFSQLVSGDLLGILVLVIRDGLLLTATIIACRRLWRATAPRPSTTTVTAAKPLPSHAGS
jgi:hypothetical protein